MASHETHGSGNHNKADKIVLWLIALSVIVVPVTAVILGASWWWLFAILIAALLLLV